MTGMLPLVEKAFGVQTDLSLLELGDASHPLLRRLAQRAPGTYNHSINVASIAESAADSIGANGLLVRVGAYFHDIGKMFKPEYFIENQSAGVNQHDSLQPAMSTLVIIAHVKDGADLARSHHLARTDHRLYLAASRNDAGRILLSRSSAAKRRKSQWRIGQRQRFSLSRSQAADAGSGRDDAWPTPSKARVGHWSIPHPLASKDLVIPLPKRKWVTVNSMNAD